VNREPPPVHRPRRRFWWLPPGRPARCPPAWRGRAGRRLGGRGLARRPRPGGPLPARVLVGDRQAPRPRLARDRHVGSGRVKAKNSTELSGTVPWLRLSGHNHGNVAKRGDGGSGAAPEPHPRCPRRSAGPLGRPCGVVRSDSSWRTAPEPARMPRDDGARRPSAGRLAGSNVGVARGAPHTARCPRGSQGRRMRGGTPGEPPRDRPRGKHSFQTWGR